MHQAFLHESRYNTLISVLGALGGSVIGATTPVLSNFVLQRSMTQRELTNRE